ASAQDVAEVLAQQRGPAFRTLLPLHRSLYYSVMDSNSAPYSHWTICARPRCHGCRLRRDGDFGKRVHLSCSRSSILEHGPHAYRLCALRRAYRRRSRSRTRADRRLARSVATALLLPHRRSLRNLAHCSAGHLLDRQPAHQDCTAVPLFTFRKPCFLCAAKQRTDASRGHALRWFGYGLRRLRPHRNIPLCSGGSPGRCDDGALSLLRLGRASQHGPHLHWREACMKLIDKIKRLLGIDIAREKYAYAKDPRFGYISESRIADSWVKTTCGYCSVGCGMLIGIKDGKAVASRGNPDHPVNRGKLCPKGLSEHQVLTAPGRATTPLLRKDGVLAPVSWEEAITTMVERITDIQTRQALGVIGTGQLLTEETYTLGKLVQLGLGTSNNDGNTTLCMASAVAGYKLSFGSD